jgi:hypothetical protein
MKRVMVNCCMRTLKQPWLLLCFTTLFVAAPRNARAANFCVAVNGGFGNGGNSFVGEGFTSPAKGTCKPWAGIMKSNSTVVWTSTGAACLSNDGKLLTIVLQSTDPSFAGNTNVTDTIELCPLASTLGCPAFNGQFDFSSFSGFGGPAAQVTCTTAVTKIPSTHD